MKKYTTLSIALYVTILLLQQPGIAQFSKPVVVMTGKVRNARTLEPQSVLVSIHEKETGREVTTSRSNSASGKYLVTLKPKTQYIVRIQAADVEPKEFSIETPRITDKTVTVIEDIEVTEPSDHTGILRRKRLSESKLDKLR